MSSTQRAKRPASKLIAYVIDGHQLEIRPAPVDRPWMDRTDQRFAYRCLPLNIANAYGWEILCPAGFLATWDGTDDLSCISVIPDSGQLAPAISHFGHGILTFHIPCLFRTARGFDLVVQGPINRPKDAIAALTGVIETDWSPYSFTMNWLFTRPQIAVRFETGEPFCHVLPIRRGDIEAVEPEICTLSSNPELTAEHEAWAQSRKRFNAELKQPGSEAEFQKWQKLYNRGVAPGSGTVIAKNHRTRLRLREFASDTTKPRPSKRGSG